MYNVTHKIGIKDDIETIVCVFDVVIAQTSLKSTY